MTPWDVITRLYECEINAGLQTDWDGGLIVWIGGPPYSDLSALPAENILASRFPASISTMLNPILSKENFGPDEFDQVAGWMNREAQRLFPQEYRPL